VIAIQSQPRTPHATTCGSWRTSPSILASLPTNSVPMNFAPTKPICCESGSRRPVPWSTGSRPCRFFFVKTLKRHQFRDFLPYLRIRVGYRQCSAGRKSRGSGLQFSFDWRSRPDIPGIRMSAIRHAVCSCSPELRNSSADAKARVGKLPLSSSHAVRPGSTRHHRQLQPTSVFPQWPCFLTNPPPNKRAMTKSSRILQQPIRRGKTPPSALL
jgi:hypothetical protein